MIRYLQYACLLIGIAFVAVAAVTHHDRSQSQCDREWMQSENIGEMPAPAFDGRTSTSSRIPHTMNGRDDAAAAVRIAEELTNEPHLIIKNLFFWL